jgi:DNA helicase-2/ATP-dependent DNA helicase PcrA
VQVQADLPPVGRGPGTAAVNDELRTSPAIAAALNGYRPTDEQWGAISHPLEPAHLVAGAGSGKTAVMAARIVWSIESEGFEPSQILGLTFTNKAAEELQERVRKALAAGGRHRPEDIALQTYHAFASAIVREHGLLVGVEPEAGLLSEAQQWQLVLSCIDELPPFEAIELRSSAGIVRSTLELASSVSDHIASLADIIAADERVIGSADASDDMRTTSERRIELCRAVAKYVEAKRRTQRIDFGDQVVKAVEVLEGFAEVRDSYLQRYPVVLLDEYQDTNVAQRRMVKALTGDRPTITAVGDARQAIYGWRGATMYNLIGFPAHFPKAGGDGAYAPIPLSENFRSGRKILEVANHVVRKIDPSRRPGDELRPIAANGDGRVSLALFTDERAEASFIAEQCEKMHARPAAEGRPDARWRDMAILVRRRSSMEPIYEEMSRRDIPVEVVGLSGLLRTPEVIEVVAWLRCLEGRPSANRWLARILLGPRWRIHYRDLALCARWAAGQNHELRLRLAGGDAAAAKDLAPGEVGVSLSEALEHVTDIEGLGYEAHRRFEAFRARLAELRAAASGPLLETVQEVIRRAGIADALEASGSRSAQAARQNLSNFLDHVAAFAPIEGEATLRSFLAYLDAADDAEETLEAVQPAESDSVKLMTVHAAKGLEFECVFVPAVAAAEGRKGGYVWSIFPDARASNPLTSYRMLPYEVREDSGHLPRWKGKLSAFRDEVKERAAEDERRLFYVALTRAKQRLHVTAAWWYGRGDTARGPSEFWDELESMDHDLVEVIEKAERPDQNPIVESLRGQVVWPPPPRTGADDPLFPGGLGATADRLLDGSMAMEALLQALSPGERAEYESHLSELMGEIGAIEAAIAGNGEVKEPSVPEVLYATQFVALENGDITPWDLVRPLPQRPSAARRIGTEVHRRIDERSRGVPPYPEETELDAPTEISEPSEVARLLERWEESFAHRQLARLPSGEPMVELPFVLRRGDLIIRGRIDAVYECDDEAARGGLGRTAEEERGGLGRTAGPLEIVDFKTGKRPEGKSKADQLDIYAAALRAMGLLAEGRELKLTYAFLGEEADYGD